MPPLRLALYGATTGLLAMAGFTIAARPPPLAAALAALVAYLVLLLGGVFVLRWRVFLDALVEGPRGARGVALTFDDGPDPRFTPRILEILARYRVRATFFLIGRKVDAFPEVVRAIVRAGHSVGLHSYEHDRLFALRGERRVRRDLELGIEALERATGRRPELFRPPIGHSNPTIARVVDDLALTVVGWTIGGLDGTGWARPDAVAARVSKRLRDGSIVLLHDAPEKGDREPASLAALPRILDRAYAARLDLVRLTDWLSPVASPPGAGKDDEEAGAPGVRSVNADLSARGLDEAPADREA